MLSYDVKNFLEENLSLIEAEKFTTLYDMALGTSGVHNVGELTDALLQAGINPLETLTSIPPLYLDHSVLTTFVVPAHIESLRKSAFSFAVNLKSVTLHDTCELSPNCFNMSGVEELIVPKIMIELPDDCFFGCRDLAHVDLANIEVINSGAFALCDSLKELRIPTSVMYISPNAFDGTDVTLIIDATNEYVKNFAEEHNIKVQIV